MPKTDIKKPCDSSDKDGGKVLPRRVFKGSSEKELLSNVKKILTLLANQGLLAFRRIHVMPIQVMGVRCRPNIDQNGMEDLQIYLMGGKTVYLELKSATGKQSPHQLARQRELSALGHDYLVCNSLDAFIVALRERGLSLWAFPG